MARLAQRGLPRHARYLPDLDWGRFLSLGEGETPLVESGWFAKALGLKRLYFKLEHCNPSGSYKDRFVALELALAAQRGVRRILATSSGNTGASLAAYSARYGLECHLFLLEATPAGKLVQMAAHGAHLHRVRGFGSDPEVTRTIFDRLSASAAASGGRLVVSSFRHCPEGMAGVKSIAYEIVEQLGRAPDHTFVPVGGGGLYSAVVYGYFDVVGKGGALPRVHVVQPALSDTVVHALRSGSASAREVATVTRISGLGVPVDVDGTRALGLARACGGEGFLPTDEEILAAQRDLMRHEGLFVEPAGAAAVAGLRRAVADGRVGAGDVVVCLLTGHGFKDPASLGDAENAADLIDVAEIPQVVGTAPEGWEGR
mgnify:CR=1 FL=1